MADFSGLGTLKNVFLAPLNRVRPFSLRTPPATTATSLITRHDHHNIEIKTVSELCRQPSIVETDIYLFVPRSFELNAIGKTELAKDFRSRMRLALPTGGEQSTQAFESALASFQASLERLEAVRNREGQLMDSDHPLCEELLEAAKDLSGVMAGILKHCASEDVRQFFLSHTLMTTTHASLEGLKCLGDCVQRISKLIERMRSAAGDVLPPSVVRKNSQSPGFDVRSPASVFALLDEYVSQLYVQYLGKIRSELSKIGCPEAAGIDPEDYIVVRQDLEARLDRLQEAEAKHRVRFGSDKPETELDRERRLVRLSQLKKFFQSKTFVEVTRRQSASKISESTATIGTAVAALVAALIERYSRPEVTDVAFQGLFVLCFGVIFYVLRDRLKDRAKALFQQKVLQILPDFEQQLMAGEQKMGTVKEWFRILTRKDIPKEVLKLRRMASANEMEGRLPEDVFHCRKIQEVAAAPASSHQNGPVRSLHENTRVNVERYLKHMDDPFKEFTDLDLTGRFLNSRSHRVYHFYVCVKTVTRPLEPAWAERLKPKSESERAALRKEQALVSRVVLDKNGVVRLEDFS